jgi:hypothetical protein
MWSPLAIDADGTVLFEDAKHRVMRWDGGPATVVQALDPMQRFEGVAWFDGEPVLLLTPTTDDPGWILVHGEKQQAVPSCFGGGASAASPDGGIWACLGPKNSVTTFRVDGTAKTWTAPVAVEQGLAVSNTGQVAIPTTTSVWIGAEDGKPTRQVEVARDPSSPLDALAFDGSGTLWIGHDTTIVEVRPDGKRKNTSLGPTLLSTFAPWPDGMVRVTYNDGYHLETWREGKQTQEKPGALGFRRIVVDPTGSWFAWVDEAGALQRSRVP